MGIRFRCHICNQPLNVKDFQAGKRGRCPGCQGSFRIPQADAEFSIPLESEKSEAKTASVSSPPAKSTQRESKEPSVATLERSPSVQSPLPQPSTETSLGDIPESLLPHLDARWFVRPPSGGQYGPSDTRTLLDWISQHRVTPDSFLWREGMETWQLADELLPELFGSAAPRSADPQSATQDAPPPVVSPISSPGADLIKESSKGSLATAKANLSQRRKKKQMRTWIIIGLLVTIALGLVAILAVVLMK